ncbi:MAG TPA: hypothetical protein VFS00_24535 [Polyangiaceae bacterium]|nr:hypothetical protein [Polyangiaceae bacterium]
MSPSAQRSTRVVSAPPSICSLAMKSGVPCSSRLSVCRSDNTFAMPKSSTFTTGPPRSRSARNKFSGFKSRCTIGAARPSRSTCPCARASASATCGSAQSTSAGASGPCWRTSASSVRPCNSSIARKGRPS